MATNVLRISLPKFHDGDDAIIHIGRLAKVCVTNGEDTDAKNYNVFLQHYEEKMQVGLLIMKQQTMLQLGRRGSMCIYFKI